MSSVVQKAHTKSIDSYVLSAADCHQIDVATASWQSNSTLNSHPKSEVQSKSLSFCFAQVFVVVEWIDGR
eukprot:scaffold22185_cov108-Skeletonema_dohrnii-CCMP3373.AAC.1